MTVMPWSLAVDMSKAGWPQRERGSGLHIALIRDGGAAAIESTDFVAMPSATAILAALLREGYARQVQELLARYWLSTRDAK